MASYDTSSSPSHSHSHSHSHGHGEAAHSHSHSHAHEGDGHSHAHLHEHVDSAHVDSARQQPNEDDAKGDASAAAVALRAEGDDLPAEEQEEEEYRGPAERLVVPADATEIPQDATEIRYTGTSGLKITVIAGLETLTSLKALTLRCNLISDASPVAANGKTLEHLELYDNQVKSLKGVEECRALRVLDVSFNVIRSSKPVAFCSKLVELYIAANKLRVIEGVSNLTSLTKLDLGANRVREMPEEGGFPRSLRHLFLGKNRIEKIRGLDRLSELSVLDVQSNRLTSLAGAFPPTTDARRVAELYLAHNAIGDDLASDHLEPLKDSLNTLDLSHNRLTSLTPLSVLTSLEDLWASYNRVPTLDDVCQSDVANLPLVCVYLEHNPCAAEPRYVTYLRDTFPHLEQVDAVCYPRRDRRRGQLKSDDDGAAASTPAATAAASPLPAPEENKIPADSSALSGPPPPSSSSS